MLRLVSCAILLSTATYSANTRRFTAPLSSPAGAFPIAVAVADFNRDGKPDAVVANKGRYAKGSLDFMPGKGYGTFGKPVTILRRQITQVLTADFNGDGNPDVAAIDGQGVLHVFLGNGDGTFRESFSLQGFSTGMVTGDWNGDGKPDLALLLHPTLSVLLGNGDGTFQSRIKLADTEARYLKSADVNGDGHMDLAVLDTDYLPTQLTVFFGAGDGTFGSGVASTLGIGGLDAEVEDFALADFNGDGKPDIVIGGLGSAFNARAAIALGNGDGTFGAMTGVVSTGFRTLHVATGDFNLDGKLDLALLSESGLEIIPGNGNGTFQQEREWVAIGGGFADAGGLTFADVNGDGVPDAVVANAGTYALDVLLGNPSGTFQSAQLFPLGSVGRFAVTADFNNDGYADVVLAGPDAFYGGAGPITVSLGAGDGTFHAPIAFPSKYFVQQLLTGDLNKDGKADLLAVTIDSSSSFITYYISVFLGKGDGTFGAEADYPLPPVYGDAFEVALADFNGDGKLDLAIADTNSISVRFGNGDGSFADPVSVPSGTYPSALTAMDVNGDGKQDLVYSGGGNNGYVLVTQLGNGDGTFGAPITYGLPQNLSVAQLSPGDFNGDGKLDLAALLKVENNLATVATFAGDGAGHFTLSTITPVSSLANNLAVADFNGDGKPDIVFNTSGGNNAPGDSQVHLMTNRGDGTFLPTEAFLAGPQPHWVLAVDLNGDGAPDVVAVNAGLAVLLNTKR